MTQPIDYVEALDKLKFYLTRMIADDFDRYEEENKIDIFAKERNNSFDIFYHLNYRVIRTIVEKNLDFTIHNIEDNDIENIVKINKLYCIKIGDGIEPNETLKSNLKRHFIKCFQRDNCEAYNKLNTEIVKQANKRRWICSCGLRILPNHYEAHLKSKKHSRQIVKNNTNSF